jgi:hypothetical protein
LGADGGDEGEVWVAGAAPREGLLVFVVPVEEEGADAAESLGGDGRDVGRWGGLRGWHEGETIGSWRLAGVAKWVGDCRQEQGETVAIHLGGYEARTSLANPVVYGNDGPSSLLALLHRWG